VPFSLHLLQEASLSSQASGCSEGQSEIIHPIHEKGNCKRRCLFCIPTDHWGCKVAICKQIADLSRCTSYVHYTVDIRYTPSLALCPLPSGHTIYPFSRPVSTTQWTQGIPLPSPRVHYPVDIRYTPSLALCPLPSGHRVYPFPRPVSTTQWTYNILLLSPRVH
jgi:hypothetical protein